jgi:glycine betaine/proline transport system substrate-binding protein
MHHEAVDEPERRNPMHKLSSAACMLVLLIALVACQAQPTPTSAPGAPLPTTTPGVTATPARVGTPTARSLKLGAIAWDEDIALRHVVKVVLEQHGYTVTFQLADVGALYEGVARGDLDAFLDTWLPYTQAIYWERYKDRVIKLDPWFSEAKLCLAVPQYTEVRSIDQLNTYRDKFGGVIVGIEPGAGMMNVVQSKVIPGYQLNFTLQPGSTPAMLAALKAAIDKQQWIVVTAWRPHWMFTAYPISCLEDPKGLMGGTEQLSAIVSKQFAERNDPALSFIKNIRLTAEQLESLEFEINNAGDPELGARRWVERNRELVNSWLLGTGLS